ncbi:MAG: hypothetical protein AAGA93_10820 [Actinomycetota bacterium]
MAAVAAGAALAALLTPAAGQAPGGDRSNGPDVQSPTADVFVRGQEAVEFLGDNGAQAASDAGFTPDDLRNALLTDPTLFVDPSGELAYFELRPPNEPEPPADSSSDGPVAAPPTNGPEFQLASLPGAEKTIYLDFTGHTTIGTTWNSAYGVSTIVSPPYDINGNEDVWSAQELTIIRDTWAVVAEDFAPFNVNVTTIEPPVDDLRRTGGGDTRWGARVVITDDTFANCGCGGHAYIGAFDDSVDEPTFVYNTSFRGVSEASTHEVGHMLNLAHDGTASAGYYRGHSGGGAPSWGAIMGAAYSVEVAQWSQQEYTGANNNGSGANYGNGRDDLAIIASLTNGNGFGYRPDDHGDLSNPTPLVGAGPVVDGIIGDRNDIDAFSFSTSGGGVSFSAQGADISPNLDITLTLRNSFGGTIVSNNSAALSAALSANLAAGTYTMTVDGTGAGNPFADPPTGYTDYNSMGQYTLTGSISGVGGPPGLTLLDEPCVLRTDSLAANQTKSVTVAGQCGVPTQGLDAAVVSLLSLNPQGVGNLRLSAAGVTPEGGVVNYNNNDLSNGNTVVVSMESSGSVDVTANNSGTDYRLIVLGYINTAGELRYNPVTPCALADSRSNQGPTGSFVGPFGPGAAYPDVDVVGSFPAGQGGGNTNCGIPAGADAVMVNVVAVGATGGSGGLAVGTGGTEPSVVTTGFSDIGLNNAVSMIVPLGGGQTIATNVFGDSGSPTTHIRLVALGYYDTTGVDYTATNACAIFDTRSGEGASGGFLGKRNDGTATTYQITGSPSGQGGVSGGCGVPAGATAVLINLVSIQPDAVGNFRAYATGTSPTGGVLNFAPTSPAMNNSNAVVVPLSTAGQLSLFTNAPPASGGDATHARGVILGYFG